MKTADKAEKRILYSITAMFLFFIGFICWQVRLPQKVNDAIRKNETIARDHAYEHRLKDKEDKEKADKEKKDKEDKENSEITQVPATGFNATESYTLIGRKTTKGAYFRGYIDEIVILKRALTAKEIKNFYEVGSDY